MNSDRFAGESLPRFDRDFMSEEGRFSRIGNGEIGGKAHGLVLARDILRSEFADRPVSGMEIAVPGLVVITTDVFDAFMARNGLAEVVRSDLPDERIAHAFQQAQMPTEIVGDLKTLIDQVRTPLAVRSSSLLEDALFRPFAGVYETKMTPNNQHDPSLRFRKLVEAVKFVWSSTFFSSARSYIRATDRSIDEEKMAVIVQEVAGRRWSDRFYPHLSGVCRSYNYYPSARTRPEEGVVNLALGLGKTIVDGGVCWTYCPARPRIPPPFASARDQLKNTQTRFWAVNMGKPPAFDPIAEAEFLVESGLADAEYDDTLAHVASTYDAQSDRLVPGMGVRGPRVVNFAPLLDLERYRLNETIRRVLSACERGLDAPVEIEFAADFPARGSQAAARMCFLQVRPMVVSDERVEVSDDEMSAPEALASSRRAMGNGVNDDISDVVYVKPDSFEASRTRTIATHLEKLNARLMSEGRPYLLIGFGRWGSSDPWLGIPVNWGQICGAKAIVEATLPNMNVEPSQGSHFFHNLSSFRVGYFTISHDSKPGIDWAWLAGREAVAETELVRHIRLRGPLQIKLDGRTGRGVIRRPG